MELLIKVCDAPVAIVIRGEVNVLVGQAAHYEAYRRGARQLRQAVSLADARQWLPGLVDLAIEQHDAGRRRGRGNV